MREALILSEAKERLEVLSQFTKSVKSKKAVTRAKMRRFELGKAQRATLSGRRGPWKASVAPGG